MGNVTEGLVPDNLTGVYNSEYSDDRTFGMYIYLEEYSEEPSKKISDEIMEKYVNDTTDRTKKKKSKFSQIVN